MVEKNQLVITQRLKVWVNSRVQGKREEQTQGILAQKTRSNAALPRAMCFSSAVLLTRKEMVCVH